MYDLDPIQDQATALENALLERERDELALRIEGAIAALCPDDPDACEHKCLGVDAIKILRGENR